MYVGPGFSFADLVLSDDRWITEELIPYLSKSNPIIPGLPGSQMELGSALQKVELL